MNYKVPGTAPYLPEVEMQPIPVDWFDDQLFASNEVVNQYCRDCAIEIYQKLNLGSELKTFSAVDELINHYSFASRFRYALIWILRTLHSDNLLEHECVDGVDRYKQLEDLPASERVELRQLALDINEKNRGMLDLLDVAINAYPDIASGKVKGEEALFGLGELQLWLDFFQNDNPIYAVNNRIAARVAVEAIQGRDKINILEFGAGAGSGSEALLDELARRGKLDIIEGYWVTEPNAFFHRKGARLLQSKYPDVPLHSGTLDINKPWKEQLQQQKFDLIYSVNTLHVGKSIGFVLEQAKQHLQGWLIAGECLRPYPEQAVYIEMIFQILDSFIDVDLDKTLRPQPGFLTPEQWQGWLQQSGYANVSIKPDIESIREYYPRFITGSVCGYHAG